MELDIDPINGQTPLDDEEKEGLLIKSITTRGELDELEQQNIEKAMLWLKSKKFSAEQILSEKFVKELHRHMYGGVWKWAGAEGNTASKRLEVHRSPGSLTFHRQTRHACSIR